TPERRRIAGKLRARKRRMGVCASLPRPQEGAMAVPAPQPKGCGDPRSTWQRLVPHDGEGGGGRGWARPGPPLSSWGSRAVVRHALVGGVGVAIPALGSAAPSTPVAVLCPCATILMW